MAMSSRQHQLQILTLSVLGVLAGCTGIGVMGPPGLEEGSTDVIGSGMTIVEELDRNEGLRAVAVLPSEEAEAAARAHHRLPALLAVVSTYDDEALWPIGEERVLDAALGPRVGEVAYIDSARRVCAAAANAPPACAEGIHALPQGLDMAPDGRVAFVADTGRGSNIWVVDPRATSGPRRLTFGTGYRNRPLFDSTGSNVAYVGASPIGLASLFRVSAFGGEPQQLTNVGLVLGPPGTPQRIPAAFVPPPRTRSSMRWDPSGIHYRSTDQEWGIDPDSGQARQEGVVQ